MLLPVVWAIAYGEHRSLVSLSLTIVITVLFGGALRWLGRGGKNQIFRREAIAVVALSWVILPMFGALPYLLDGVFASPIDAYFESVSGFSTTGATVLTEIRSSMTHATHFWRLESHWLGGMGIMVLFVAVLPSMGIGGKMLFKSEVPGPITEALTPRIKETSGALWRIYIGLTAAATVALMICGMGLWDAAGHAMSTLGTGGFSTHDRSIAGFESSAIEWTISLFMFLAGVNFSLYVLAAQGKRRAAMHDLELRTYAAVVAISGLVVSLAILERHHGSVSDAFRHGVFQVLAVVTTTGFGTDDFDAYPPLARNLLFFLMFIGGSAGSTAGGIKVFRVIVLAKAAYAQLFRTFRPQSVVRVKVQGAAIGDDVVRSVTSFFFAYMLLLAATSIVMSTMMPDLESALSSTLACLGNIGPGLSAVGPTHNYGFVPAAGKLILTACMILGRLELYTLLVLLAPAFWRR